AAQPVGADDVAADVGDADDRHRPGAVAVALLRSAAAVAVADDRAARFGARHDAVAEVGEAARREQPPEALEGGGDAAAERRDRLPGGVGEAEGLVPQLDVGADAEEPDPLAGVGVLVAERRLEREPL